MRALRRAILVALLLVPGLATWLLLRVEASAWAALPVSLGTCALGLVLDALWARSLAERARALTTSGPTLPESGATLHPAQAALDVAVARLHASWLEQSEVLQRDAETLRATLDGMAEGLWITDRSGTLLRTNRALRELLFTTRPMVGERPSSVLRNEELELAVLRACDEGRNSTLEVAIEGLRPRQLAVFVTPLAGDQAGSAAVFRDITELRRLEKVRKDFVANVSHELRTPITAIRGYAETLQNGALKDAVMAPRMVEIIHRQSERLSELVEDLLELSQLEGQELQLESELVELPTSIQRAAEAVRVKAAGKQIQLQLEAEPGIGVMGDTRAVEQVLLNLMDNAVKYTPAGGMVYVRASARDGKAVVTVRDTGLGMEPKHLERIFERFYRVDKGRSRDMGGTGLGLSIVKHLVGAMGGDIRAESRLHVGTTFTLSLTLADAPAAREG